MPRGPEAKIQDKVVAHCRAEHGKYSCRKTESGRYMVSNGWPDWEFYPVAPVGLPFFIEFKRQGGKLTELQKHVKKEIEKMGYHYYVVDDAEEGKAIIDKEFA